MSPVLADGKPGLAEPVGSTDQTAAMVEAVLWPASASPAHSVWAVLDCARDAAVYRALLDSRLEFRSLYRGPMARALEVVSPHLVELLPGHRLTTVLLGAAWGRAWGVFLRIEDPSNLHHHLRKCLRVRQSDGPPLLLRYFDPRVLRSFLQTCNAEQLAYFFGPVSAFLAEGSSGRRLDDIRVNNGSLVVREHAL